MKAAPLAELLLLLLLAAPRSVASSQVEQTCGSSGAGGDEACPSLETPPKRADADIAAVEAEEAAQLPDDFVDPCQDENPSCRAWAAEGECRANAGYMLASCARSCRSCRPLRGGRASGGEKGSERESLEATGARCVDEYEACPQWADAGECTINPSFMLKGCKYSCWRCIDAERDRRLGVNEGTIARKRLYFEMDLGKHQLIRELWLTDGHDGADPVTTEDREGVQRVLRQMDRYASTVVAKPSTEAKARERCRNDFRMCAEWAYRGDCPASGRRNEGVGSNGNSGVRDRAIFMMSHCPLACQMCHRLPSFHKCAGRRLADSRPAHHPGGIRSLYEARRVPGNPFWEEYDPVFASYPIKESVDNADDPYVAVLRNFLSDKEADELIQLGSKVGWKMTGGGGGLVASAGCRINNGTRPRCADDETYRHIMRRASMVVLADASHFEPMEMLRFDPGHQLEGPLQHNYEVDSAYHPAGPRVHSLLVFLSDGGGGRDVGGDIGFPYLDRLLVRPKKGTAVLFPNVLDEDLMQPDPLTGYEHFPVQDSADGPIYIAKVHVRLYNWTDASLRGCA